MFDLPIEIFGLFLLICLGLPGLVFMFDRSSTKTGLMITLLIIGGIWIILLWNTDNIILNDKVTATTFNSTAGNTQYEYEANNYSLSDPDTGEPTLQKDFITFVGLIFAVMPIYTSARSRFEW